jgi:hypothetical protein
MWLGKVRLKAEPEKNLNQGKNLILGIIHYLQYLKTQIFFYCSYLTFLLLSKFLRSISTCSIRKCVSEDPDFLVMLLDTYIYNSLTV